MTFGRVVMVVLRSADVFPATEIAAHPLPAMVAAGRWFVIHTLLND
jgi:hypothetical protein